VKLEVGEVTQSVQITDVAPILQTETIQTGDCHASSRPTNPGGMVTFRGGARP
jgi:hypothetical protein